MKLQNYQKGSSVVEFVIIGAFLAIVVLISFIEEGGVIDNLQEHEKRQIDAISAP